MRRNVTRRQAIVAAAAVLGYTRGVPERPVSAQARQMAQQSGVPSSPGLVLAMDGMETALTFVYRGQTRRLTPQDIIDALPGKGPEDRGDR